MHRKMAKEPMKLSKPKQHLTGGKWWRKCLCDYQISVYRPNFHQSMNVSQKQRNWNERTTCTSVWCITCCLTHQNWDLNSAWNTWKVKNV